MHVEEVGRAQHSESSFRGVLAMAESQETGSSEGTRAADTYPRKILEYMEGFLISKVRHCDVQCIHIFTQLLTQ